MENWKFKYYDIQEGPNWDLIEQNCDWFAEMKYVPQDEIWHAEGNVQIHTKMVCNALISLPEFISLHEQDKHIMFVGALMHDIEKRSTTTTEFKDGRDCIVAPKHAQKGEKTAREILYKDFDCPHYTREEICKIIKYHGKPLFDIEDKNLINLATQVKLKHLAMIAKADILGRICNDADRHLEQIEYFIMQAEDLFCYEYSRKFTSSIAEYEFLKNGNTYYEPYDDSKFEVIMMSALPGSGKDYFISNQLKDWKNVVSLDDIRKELKVKPTDKSGNGKVIQLAKERAKEFMRKKQSFVWNATNITAQMRLQLIELFESYGGKVRIIYIEVPYKTLIKQNGNREEVLPKAIIDKMIRKLEPPIREEAYKIIKYIT